MNDFRHTGIRDTGVWTTADDVPFVEVAGHAVVPSSDATLSALDLTWDDAGTATDITLNPVFNASTTSYTAGVASGVDRITIKETKGDSGATVNYFDGADSALTDADANATGFQVGLAVGANTIKAKVMASDGETTQTYTVVVTRAAGDTTAPTANGATVNGATLAIAFDEALAAAANLANGVFTVKKTPSGGSEETVALSGSPAISGATVTLTLAVAVVSTDTVTVSYTRPTSGTANALEDAAGNEVGSFTDRTVTNNTVVALRAWFQNVPDAHDGSSVFTLELAFSEAVFDGTESFDKNEVIKNALEVTSGTIAGRRRANPNVYDRWILRIRPSGDGDVTVRLPATTGGCSPAGAICTPDGRPLSTPASATIEGPSAEVPDAPSAPTLTAGETWLEASWTAPADNGAAITGYDVALPRDGRELDGRLARRHDHHETHRKPHRRHRLPGARARVERGRRRRLVADGVRAHGRGGGSAGCPVGADADGRRDVAGGIVDGAGGQRFGDHGLRRRVPHDGRELDGRLARRRGDRETDREPHGRHRLRSARACIERGGRR